jgi:hypothetical protein
MLTASPRRQWLHERAWLLRYIYIAHLVCYVKARPIYTDHFASIGYIKPLFERIIVLYFWINFIARTYKTFRTQLRIGYALCE